MFDAPEGRVITVYWLFVTIVQFENVPKAELALAVVLQEEPTFQFEWAVTTLGK